MRLLRIISLFLCVVVLAGSAILYITSRDKTVSPELTCDIKVIEGSINITDEELLSYVTAYDEQDGDLTKSIKVVRKRFFIDDKNTTVVTFAVSDSDNNVTSIQRPLKYTDYHSPRFSFNNDLILPGGYRYALEKYVSASDVIDGDLSQYLKLISSEITNTEGVYSVNIKVSNSMADTSELTVNAIVTDKDYFTVKVQLDDYITYQPVNAEIDYMAFVKGIKNGSDKNYDNDDIELDTSAVDVTKPGCYEAYYKIYADREKQELVTMTRLFVVVEE
ncbi:MAG: hypothetical protein J6Q76_00665 [Clostridia bacterium]|nr:hypothetical protein [Clostridia bacterium]